MVWPLRFGARAVRLPERPKVPLDLTGGRKAEAEGPGAAHQRGAGALAPLGLARRRELLRPLARRGVDPPHQAELPARGHPPAALRPAPQHGAPGPLSGLFRGGLLGPAQQAPSAVLISPTLPRTHLRDPRVPLLRRRRRHQAPPLQLSPRPRAAPSTLGNRSCCCPSTSDENWGNSSLRAAPLASAYRAPAVLDRLTEAQELLPVLDVDG